MKETIIGGVVLGALGWLFSTVVLIQSHLLVLEEDNKFTLESLHKAEGEIKAEMIIIGDLRERVKALEVMRNK